ncbi:MAG: hypothetical protein AABW71_00645 [Nanoarchaeota archaeon]
MTTYELVATNPYSSGVNDSFIKALAACYAISQSGNYFAPSGMNSKGIIEFETNLGNGAVTIMVSPLNGRLSILTDKPGDLRRARMEAERTLSYGFLRLEELPEFLTHGGQRSSRVTAGSPEV